jgi:hypothetical protein
MKRREKEIREVAATTMYNYCRAREKVEDFEVYGPHADGSGERRPCTLVRLRWGNTENGSPPHRPKGLV